MSYSLWATPQKDHHGQRPPRSLKRGRDPVCTRVYIRPHSWASLSREKAHGDFTQNRNLHPFKVSCLINIYSFLGQQNLFYAYQHTATGDWDCLCSLCCCGLWFSSRLQCGTGMLRLFHGHTCTPLCSLIGGFRESCKPGLQTCICVMGE